MDRTVYVVHSYELLVFTNETVTIKSNHHKCENIQSSNVLINLHALQCTTYRRKETEFSEITPHILICDAK
jgi:hypothetical protein